MNLLSDTTNKIFDDEATAKRSYIIVTDNIAAQKMIANAYSYFKERNLCLGSAAQVTACCLGISKASVLKYKNGPEENSSKIQRKRPNKNNKNKK